VEPTDLETAVTQANEALAAIQTAHGRTNVPEARIRFPRGFILPAATYQAGLPQLGTKVHRCKTSGKHRSSRSFRPKRVTKTLGVSFAVATASMWFSTPPQLRRKCTPSSCRRCATWAIAQLRAAAHPAQSLRQYSTRLRSLCRSTSGERFRTHSTCSQTSPFM